MAKKEKPISDKSPEEELVDIVNGEMKVGNASYIYGVNYSDEDVVGFCSTGCIPLDLIVSNRVEGGGMPFGRLVLLCGREQAGKSLLSYHIIASIQKMGGIAILIDNEFSVSFPFLEAIGVNVKKMIYANYGTIEETMDAIEKFILHIREKYPLVPVAIILDSIAATPSKSEVDGNYDVSGYNTDKSIVMSKSLRKLTSIIGKQKIILVLTNQYRLNVGGGSLGSKYMLPGGIAVPYHSSVTLSLTKLQDIKVGNNTIGIKIKARVDKNRIAPPKREALITIMFDRGIDNPLSLLDMCLNSNMIKPATGGWYSYKFGNEEIRFQKMQFEKKLDNIPGLRDFIYKEFNEKLTVKYRGESDENITEVDTENSTLD